MPRPSGARNRTPQEIAVDLLEGAVKKGRALKVRKDREAKRLETTTREYDRTVARIEYLASNPDLPEDYEPDLNLSEEAPADV